MPIIKSAKKRVRQTKKRTARILPYRSHMKTMIKKVLEFAKKGQKAEAEKALSVAFKAVDTAAKKQIIHHKNADNKKSRLSRVVAAIGQ